jgi:hypothetical protein
VKEADARRVTPAMMATLFAAGASAGGRPRTGERDPDSEDAEEESRRLAGLEACGFRERRYRAGLAWLTWHEERYEETGNPLHAWFAYALSRELSRPVPTWVLNYLDSVAVELWKVAESVRLGGPLPRSERPVRVLRMLGLNPTISGDGRKRSGRRPDAFDRLHDARDHHVAACFAEQKRRGLTYDAARARVASDCGVSEREVERAWQKYGHDPDNPMLPIRRQKYRE